MSQNVSIEEDVGTTCVSITSKLFTCMPIFISIAYRTDNPKKIDYVRIFGSSKHSTCAQTFLDSLSDLLTFSIRRIRNNTEATLLTKALRHHQCLNCPPNEKHYKSCVDAIGQTLEKFLTKEGLPDNETTP